MDQIRATLDNVARLDREATPGPWEWDTSKGSYGTSMPRLNSPDERVCWFGDDTQYYPSEGEEPSEEDMAYIAASRTLLPRLAAALAVAVDRLLCSCDLTEPAPCRLCRIAAALAGEVP